MSQIFFDHSKTEVRTRTGYEPIKKGDTVQISDPIQKPFAIKVGGFMSANGMNFVEDTNGGLFLESRIVKRLRRARR